MMLWKKNVRIVITVLKEVIESEPPQKKHTNFKTIHLVLLILSIVIHMFKKYEIGACNSTIVNTI